MDKRALRILLGAFWSASGWKPESQRNLADKDFAYAKSQGMMFDPVQLTHRDAVERLVQVVRRIERRQAVDAFLASLSTRRLDWRSALGSYAVFQHFASHQPTQVDNWCSVCGFNLNRTEHDFNVLNFERHKWGGVRHDHVEYALLDLETFADAVPPKPTEEDIAIFRSLIRVMSSVSVNVTSAQLQAHLAGALKSNKAERDVLIAILGYCGVLGVPAHPGYNDSFVSNNMRRLPDRHFVDMPYPACWWNGATGLNHERLREYFAHALQDAA